MDADYIKSERFIHDELCREAGRLGEGVKWAVKRDQKFQTCFFIWPAEHLKTPDGTVITHAVFGEIPTEYSAQETQEALHKAVTRLKAYGLVLFEVRDGVLRVLFETHQGARAWLTPFKQHGDLMSQGETEVRDNADCVGLLWRPTHAVA